ncbi:DUF221-domain-containing protein [Microthyrium microscopicum]|uniref:DUF221-domain-containing protein n=1 Tax=Microthyrium microscopicum TaxID=703497 RepID=A0A6A6TX34_9PEZI|nr:DUF221-domain-containing protein [Microthyrium microscopicum]
MADILSNSTAGARAVQGQSASSFASALGFGILSSVAQLLVFVLVKDRLPNIYQPKSFLVPERQRSKPIPPGIWQWVKPMFEKADDDFLRKCGLDAYFLSRYLFVLLKILFPISVLVLPILLAIDATGGNNIASNVVGTGRNVTQGLDVLTMSNLQPKVYSRYWAHCILAIFIVVWTCYVIVQELRNFIRVRQTFLTSPQHRLRASATTVLVRGLPRKYTDPNKLEELFDVYPGGIRNIWVTHDFVALAKLIKQRDGFAKKLEGAETKLIQKCWKAHRSNLAVQKKSGSTKDDVPQLDGPEEIELETLTGEGISINNPGQVHHNVDEAVDAMNHDDVKEEAAALGKQNLLGRGMGAVNQGIQTIGRGIGDIGNKMRGRSSEEGADGERSRGMSRFISRKHKKNRSDGHDQDTAEDGDPETIESRDQTEDNRVSSDNGRESNMERKSGETGKELPFDPYYDQDNHLTPEWAKYIGAKDRPTMKVKTKTKFIPSFMNPWATKVDTIYHCRRELARLNKLIERLQNPDNEGLYPLMKSAFIQFNNQAAAHMACQSLAHHSPTFMTPRLIEIAPNDVIWENMAIPGWAAVIRKGIVFVVCTVLVVLWTPLIALASAFSQVDALRKNKYFSFLSYLPPIGISIVQGVVPVILVSLLILLLGIVLRVVVKRAGAPTNMMVELTVQKYFFVFSFIQYFLVVTIASALALLFTTLTAALEGGNISVFLIPQLLAQNIPISSNYFLSQILLQSLSQSAGGLLQPITLLGFAWNFFRNRSARKQFRSRTSLQTMNWGTTYPLYTTLACIALIYSVISPLILPLSMVGFGIWWISTRYQMLYIYSYRTDTSGLLFPMALKQLFTGLFVLELFLIGYFIIISTGSSDDPNASTAAVIPMTVVMAIVLVATIIFFFVLKSNFDPLLEFLPITLEDDAVKRDEEFERLLAEQHAPEDETEMLRGAAEGGPEDHDDDEEDAKNINDPVRDVESQKRPDSRTLPTDHHARSRNSLQPLSDRGSWATHRRRSKAWSGSRSPSHHHSLLANSPRTSGRESAFGPSADQLANLDAAIASANDPPESSDSNTPFRPSAPDPEAHDVNEALQPQTTRDRTNFRTVALDARTAATDITNNLLRPLAAPIAIIAPDAKIADQQAQRLEAEANEIYGGIPDDLENLTPEQRDVLLSRAFRHKALRAKRPCIWIPRDVLGVADDEVRNTGLFTGWIWISDEKQVLTTGKEKVGKKKKVGKGGKCVYKGAPPDFDEVELIQL